MVQLEKKGKKMSIVKIDKITDLDLDTITLEELAIKFHTGHAYIKSQNGRHKEFGYRMGVMTPLGDIEQSVWVEAVERVIKKIGEWDLQLKLREWYKKDLFAQKDNLCALEAHSIRLYQDPKWVDYRKFNGLD